MPSCIGSGARLGSPCVKSLSKKTQTRFYVTRPWTPHQDYQPVETRTHISIPHLVSTLGWYSLGVPAGSNVVLEPQGECNGNSLVSSGARIDLECYRPQAHPAKFICIFLSFGKNVIENVGWVAFGPLIETK